MIKVDSITLVLILTFLCISLYTGAVLHSLSLGGVYSVSNHSSQIINFDLSSVSDFEDSFMLLSDSVLFLEQDGVFVFDYYMGVLSTQK